MKILIGYDGSMLADGAIDDLQWAGLPTHAEAIVLSAVEWRMNPALLSWGTGESDISSKWTHRIAVAEQAAEAGAGRLQKYFPRWDIQVEASGGQAVPAILQRAAAWPADLVVVGTHGRSALARVVLGSVSMKLVHEAPCSMRIARPSRRNTPMRLLLGTDGSAGAGAVIGEVCRRSWPAGTEVRVLSVQEMLVPAAAGQMAVHPNMYGDINEDEHLRLRFAADDAVARLQKAGLEASPVIQEGDPGQELLQLSREWSADTVFVGARGLGPVERILLGSVSAATVAQAPCTVEIVRAQIR